MAHPASDAKQYFVGIAGQQTGPFGEAELVGKIQSGSIPADALVWYEGLAEWQPIKSFPPFKSAFSGGDSAGGALPAPTAKATFKSVTQVTKPSVSHSSSRSTADSTPMGSDRPSTFVQSVNESEPVFDKSEAVFSQNPFIKNRMLFIAAGVGGFAALAAGAFFLVSSFDTTKVMTPKVKTISVDSREASMRKALSELLLSPQPSLATLSQLVRDNSQDEIGKQSLEAAVDYYKTHSPSEGGRLLLSIKQPLEAQKFFLMDPPSYLEAEQATYQAFQAETDPAKKKALLLQDIALLLAPLSNLPLATERVKIFETTYPGESHPYGYYLRATDDKIKDMFDRISFFFVQTLLAYIHTEFPQINLVGRPLVEMKKDKQSNYRIVASYSGDVILNNDRLNKIFFTFWLAADRWTLVDTNLTIERKKSSVADRDRLKNATLSGTDMIRNLEQIFRGEYPKTPLHEKVSAIKPKPTF